MKRTQLNRDFSFRCALPDDALLFVSMDGREELGRPFEYRVELRSEHADIDPNDLIGRPAAVLVRSGDQTERCFEGIVAEFVAEPARGRLSGYRAVLVPWLWLLSKSSDCRIFQDQSAPAIVKRVFRDFGLGEFREALTATYGQREYCVQYRESAFAFVCRLMEEEGIYYYFDHAPGRHRLVLSDSLLAHDMATGCADLPLREDGGARTGEEYVWGWTARQVVKTGRFSHNAFDFQAPRKQLHSSGAARARHPAGALEMFDYSTRYADLGVGEHLSRVRIEEIHARQREYRARTNARGISVGSLIGVRGAPGHTTADHLLVVAAQYRIVGDPLDSRRAEEPSEPQFACEFAAIDAAQPFRPEQVTPRPTVRGVQTAMVTGPAGEEIWTDRHGRVKVQFHWDRYGQGDENSSCWIRVSQPWAGKGWGGMAIPRVGQEVIVDFLEGDPDRPIITGRVYNNDSMPHHGLPAAKARTSIRSNSYPGGGGYNELTMDDSAGKELFLIKAQHDHQVEVGHDRQTHVGNDSAEKVDANLSQEVALNAQEKVGVNKMIDVGQNLVIKAGTSITLQCGAATIHMNQAGFITISGTVVTMAGAVNANVAAPVTTVTGGLALISTGGVANVSCGANTLVEGFAHATLDGGKTSVKGVSETVIKGAKVKIND